MRKAVRCRPGKSVATARLLVAGVVAASLLVAANSARAGACTDSALAAGAACRHGARSDLLIASGRCLNLPPAARPACAAAAAAGRDEALQLCGEQIAARKRVCAQLGEAPYHPAIRPTQFVDPELIGGPVAPNPFFPIVAGTTWVYQGGGEDITVTVTGATRTILGVTCRVVRDVVEVGGTLVEDTEDWYAQDVDGNVWYFGELSQNFAAGRLDSLDGSWEAGVDGAKPGLVMAAAPAAGALYRQEFALGTAEDLARVLRTTASASVPAAACSGTCVKTFDFTPLEPDAREFKFYAPGVGLILEVDPETGQRVELVGVTP